MGNRKTLMMAWKPCVESRGQAIRNPSAVSANDSNTRNAATSTAASSEIGIPRAGAIARKSPACSTASAVPPHSFPSTSAGRLTGATSTACRKPSRRSSIIEMVENIAQHGRADLHHTLNTLDLDREDGLAHSVHGDQYREDLFFRYNQTLQYFFDASARVKTEF